MAHSYLPLEAGMSIKILSVIYTIANQTIRKRIHILFHYTAIFHSRCILFTHADMLVIQIDQYLWKSVSKHVGPLTFSVEVSLQHGEFKYDMFVTYSCIYHKGKGVCLMSRYHVFRYSSSTHVLQYMDPSGTHHSWMQMVVGSKYHISCPTSHSLCYVLSCYDFAFVPIDCCPCAPCAGICLFSQ